MERRHKCTLKTEASDQSKWRQSWRLVSLENPLRLSYFRSNVSVKEEQIRQQKMSNYVIHPFSKFRAWYEIYLIYLYGSVLISKPLDAGYVISAYCSSANKYIYYNIFVDFLCWVDIILNFMTGYERRRILVIELRKWHIAKNYILSPYFMCDILSSIPKCLLYRGIIDYMSFTMKFRLSGVASILGLFKVVRIISFVKYIWKTGCYFHFNSIGLLSLVCTLSGAFMIVHWLTCMQFVVPQLVKMNFSPAPSDATWFFSHTLYNATLYTNHTLLRRYNHSFMKCSSYILGLHLTFYTVEETNEYLLAIVTYFIGKILIGFIWIILVIAILNGRIMEIKFAEVVNQLQEYMTQKQLPLSLRNRMLQHFNFKYQDKYFKEELITSLLSDNLKMEASMYTCRSLISSVSLFQELSVIEISKVVQYLVPEIYLPTDTIIRAGTKGDAMYFLSTGTVAVYTHSGKEICHLQDGAYFGEISLVVKGQLRSATVTALETSHVYRLNNKDLEKCLLNNKTVLYRILKNAEERLKEITKIEEEYKDLLFEKSLRAEANLIK